MNVIQYENDKLSSRLFCCIGIIITVLFVGTYFTIFSFSDYSVAFSSQNQKSLHVNNSDGTNVASASPQSNYIFLISGTDVVSGLSDVLLLVNLDIENSSVNILQIPRDTYFEYTTHSYKKINAASKTLGGLSNLALLLEDALKVDIDYTLEISLYTLSQFIDLIDGVEITIPYDMDYEDASQNLYIHLKAGDNILKGDAAAQFVRFRSGYVQGDVARLNAQKIFMAALVDKCLNRVSKFKIPALVGALIGKVNTDMPLNMCIELARMAMDVEISNITMLTLSGADSRTGIDHGAWYYIVNRAAAIETINAYFRNAESQISDSEFDPNKLFSTNKYEHFAQIYESLNFSIDEYRADDIIKEGIDIDLIDY
jgi:LCP family protein required for cell wall assembly